MVKCREERSNEPKSFSSGKIGAFSFWINKSELIFTSEKKELALFFVEEFVSEVDEKISLDQLELSIKFITWYRNVSEPEI